MTQSDLSDFESVGASDSDQFDDKRGEPDGYKDEETLRRLYHDEGNTQVEIGEMFGVSGAGIAYQMDKMDIETGKHNNTPYSDEEVLRKLYHDEGKSTTDIGKQFGVSAAVIYDKMKRNGIETRSYSEAVRKDYDQKRDHPEITEGMLQELYVEKRLSVRDAADEIGCGPGKVENRLDEYGIEKRTLTEAMRIRHTREPAHFRISTRGYAVEMTGHRYESFSVKIHRLAMVAWEGFDAVSGMVVHHKNGHKTDNREENLELMTISEHTEHHMKEETVGGRG